MTDNTPTDVSTDMPVETPPETELDVDVDLGIDVAEPPEMGDSELGAVLEALLLVVDTPATVEQLAAATGQPG